MFSFVVRSFVRSFFTHKRRTVSENTSETKMFVCMLAKTESHLVIRLLNCIVSRGVCAKRESLYG